MPHVTRAQFEVDIVQFTTYIEHDYVTLYSSIIRVCTIDEDVY